MQLQFPKPYITSILTPSKNKSNFEKKMKPQGQANPLKSPERNVDYVTSPRDLLATTPSPKHPFGSPRRTHPTDKLLQTPPYSMRPPSSASTNELLASILQSPPSASQSTQPERSSAGTQASPAPGTPQNAPPPNQTQTPPLLSPGRPHPREPTRSNQSSVAGSPADHSIDAPASARDPSGNIPTQARISHAKASFVATVTSPAPAYTYRALQYNKISAQTEIRVNTQVELSTGCPEGTLIDLVMYRRGLHKPVVIRRDGTRGLKDAAPMLTFPDPTAVFADENGHIHLRLPCGQDGLIPMMFPTASSLYVSNAANMFHPKTARRWELHVTPVTTEKSPTMVLPLQVFAVLRRIKTPVRRKKRLRQEKTTKAPASQVMKYFTRLPANLQQDFLQLIKATATSCTTSHSRAADDRHLDMPIVSGGSVSSDDSDDPANDDQ